MGFPSSQSRGFAVAAWTAALVAAGLAVLDIALRIGDFVADGQLTMVAAVWLSVLVLIAFLGLAITVRWVLLNWSRLSKRVEAQVDERYKALIEESKDFFIVVGRDQEIVYMSPSATAVFTASIPSSQTDLVDVVVAEDREALAGLLAEPTIGHTIVAVTLTEEYGDEIVELQANHQLDNPNVEGVVLTGRVVTAAKRLEHRLAEMALKDELTKLPNRWAFTAGLKDSLARAKRDETGTLLILIDLAGFKGVNDTLGHDVGDQLLRRIAGRLTVACRSGELLARLGSDEFAIVAEGVNNADQASALARRLMDEVRRPLTIDGQVLTISAGIGVALTHGGVDADEFLQQADIALYDSKSKGQSNIVLFRQEMADLRLAETRLVHEIDSALAKGEFFLAYQPLVSLDTGECVAFEALMRWKSPVLGDVGPITFIPVAERTGRIVEMGRWALRESCSMLRQWRDLVPQQDLKMSVNASMVQLHDPSFVRDVIDAIRDAGIPPTSLQIEVTESVMAQDPTGAAARLQTLQNLGVQIAIDDFGTGYSSMAQLQQLPVDTIKIDRAFIKELTPGNDQAESVVRALIDLAVARRTELVAEGVEDRGQLEVLRKLGVPLGQGFLFAHPLSDVDVPVYLEAAAGIPGDRRLTEA